MPGNYSRPRLFTISCLLFLLVSTNIVADDTVPENEISVTAHDGTELVIHQYAGTGKFLMVWVASSYGMHDRVYSLFRALAKNGIEVWQVDFSDSLFQPRTSNLMRNLDARYVSNIVSEAHKRTGKQIILMARAYGAIPVLRGATLWHQANPDENYLAGLVLFSPDLYTEIPQLGLDPEYVPVTSATSIPVMIYQAQNRGTGWQLPRLLASLSVHNENVYYKIMSGVSGIFYHNDMASETQTILERLPTELPVIFRLLAKTEKTLPDKNYIYKNTTSTAFLDNRLKPYKAHPVANPIRLHDINGKLIELNNYKGQVTLVNFWATWCPPCVHEIPSLNNLKSKMKGKNFQLISINYAEEPETVRNFLEQVKVDFPVLMDVDNKVSAQWNVIAFPSTFVVGSDGNIHYGVNAAIEWDDPKIIRILESL